MQNYYEITNALLSLDHVQNPVDVGGFSAMARKSFVHGIVKSRGITSGFTFNSCLGQMFDCALVTSGAGVCHAPRE